MSGIPVIKDARLGCVPDISQFTDTPQHPCAAGVEKQCDIIGNALKNNLLWTREELLSILASYGWNENGKIVTEAEIVPVEK